MFRNPMIVDSYRFLPRSLRPYYEGRGPFRGEEEPLWAPSKSASTRRRSRSSRRQVLELGLRVLAGAASFGTRVDFDLEWPVPLREAYRAWQPAEPSPIVRKLIEARRGSNA